MITRELLRNSRYEILDLKTKTIIKICPNRKAAVKFCDKKELEYGATRYSYERIIENV